MVDFNLTKPVHTIWCRLMLQRYLGKFLDRNLELEQLSVDLVGGNVRIEDLSLNVNAINEVFTNINLPLKLIDGYIGMITIDVPWTCLMAKATKMKITDLQLTFEPSGIMKFDDRDAINSMVGSVVNSLVSSGELAKSVIEEAQKEHEDVESLDSFAKVIDAIYSRFCVEFENTTIRFEQQSKTEMSTALEVRCETIRFMDEQMRACQQDQQSAENITSQPHGIGNITNLNKFVTIDGLSFHTDVFSNISDVAAGIEANVLITSMHIRREKMKQQSPTRSPQHSLHPDMYASVASNMTAFHSCYNSLSHESGTFSPDHLEPVKPVPTEPELFSDPIKFAEIVGQTTIVFRLKNAATNTVYVDIDENKIETDVYIKGINVFASPSQIAILKRFVSSVALPATKIGEGTQKRMDPEDYEAIVKKIEETNSGQARGVGNGVGGMNGGGWSNADDFREFDSINLHEIKGRRSCESKDFNTLKNTTTDKEEVRIKSTVGTLVMIITHCDYLSTDYVKENGGYHNAISTLQKESSSYFKKSKDLVFSAQTSLESIRSRVDKLYSKDHLQIIGSALSVSYVAKRIASSESMTAKFLLTNCDVLEYLTKESVPSSSHPIRVPLLDYSNMENEENDPNLKLVVSTSSETKGEMKVEVFVSACKTELDFSMVDRIANLLVTQPFFDEQDIVERSGSRKDIPQLKDDLFPTGVPEETDSTTSVSLICKNWFVDLRIPIADLRDPSGSRLPFAQRHIHDEYLKISLKDVELRLKQVNSGVDISCAEICADFCGSKLDIAPEQQRILYGTKDGFQRVKIEVEIDPRTKRIPIVTKINIPYDMSKSFSNPMISYCDSGDQNLCQSGTRAEILEFQNECLEFAAVKLIFDVPLLKLHFPEKKNLEILYNRLINDLALFQPAHPALREGEGSLNINAIDAFHECSTPKKDSDGSDYELEDEIPMPQQVKVTSSLDAEDFDRTIPHTFVFSLNIKKGKVLCNTEVKENNIKKCDGQVAMELDGVHLGTTVGYHGDVNHTFFHITSSKTSIGSSADPNVVFQKKIESKEFGKWGKTEGQFKYVAKDDELSTGTDDDSLAVGLHMHFRPEDNIKDVLLCIALRNSELQARPVADLGLFWATQIAELFTLQDYAIPGYELPQVTTDLHITLENMIGNYDHSWINPKSNIKLRALFGACNLSSSLLTDLNISKTLCIIEKTCIYMSNDELGSVVTFESNNSNKKSLIPILDIGLVQFDILLAVTPDNITPAFEIKCKNDIIQLWSCSDSLSTLVNVIVEITQSEKLKSKADEKEEEQNDDSKSVACESTWSATSSRHTQKMSVNSSLPADIELRIQQAIEDATREEDQIGIPVGQDALADFRTCPPAEKSDDTPNNSWNNTQFSNDDEFCMVDEDILGSGITYAAGEARVRFCGKGGESDENQIVLESDHFSQPDEWRADGIPQIKKSQLKPLIRYLFKDLTIKIHLFAGNDLSLYARKEQTIAKNAHGGPHRDHSASISLEFNKITFMRQIFDKSAKQLTSTLFSIGDVVIKDRVVASNIKDMLYQYSCSDQPRRTNAPLISIRISETQSREGKMRISMLPIKINVDQDTLEFMTDFFEDTFKALKLPEVNTNSLAYNRPTIEVPVDICSMPSKSSSGSLNQASSKLYPNLQRPSLNMEPLTPSPVTPSPLGDLSYFETCQQQESPVKRPIIDAPLTASAVSIGNMFSSPRQSRLSNEEDLANISFELNDSDDMTGDWHDECNSHFQYPTTADDILSKSTMMGSIHPAMVDNLVDTSDDNEDHGNFLDGLDDDENVEEKDSETSTIRRSNSQTSVRQDEYCDRDTFFKEFIFSPSVNIYVDYQGKRKISTEKGGALVGLLMAFGQLNQMPIVLREIENRNGMLGIGRCFNYAVNEWSGDMLTNMPSVLASCGPISPLVQIGKGFWDLFWMPVEEMRKDDGRVVKGIQKGVGSFGVSSAAGIVGMAQTVTGFVQSFAELTMREMRPYDMHLKKRPRKSSRTQSSNPTDVRHGLQLAYTTLVDGYRQTRDDLELAAQEDRASGNSVVRSACRYAVPAFLSPIVMASQVTYQLLGGLRNQLRPDVYRDERRKWGEDNVPGGIGRD
ncbi:unnamed protein product [Caenorhabditis angaria]|uniref:Autophagy-related protein 2 n=1 Tax=Caenorhabditis angaria TaxID=860376 RepID=A0A9P1N8R4_9PELO|nr:unnamed protein product [Caenorhabditis angaria]